MGTRSWIAMKVGNRYKAIYCHWDGYPEYNGYILKNYYKSPQKVKKLIALGDISSLGKQIGRKHPFSYHGTGGMDPDEYERKYGNMTKAYRRDRGEKGTSARTYHNKENLIEEAIVSDAEYLYIYENGKWSWMKV